MVRQGGVARKARLPRRQLARYTKDGGRYYMTRGGGNRSRRRTIKSGHELAGVLIFESQVRDVEMRAMVRLNLNRVYANTTNQCNSMRLIRNGNRRIH